MNKNPCKYFLYLSFLLLSLFSFRSAFADNQLTQRQAWVNALNVAQEGPKKLTLTDLGTLSLPVGYAFIPEKEAADLMSAMGNYTSSNFIGLVIPSSSEKNWFITINYVNAGYIKDDEAANWDAGNLLEDIKKGTEEDNASRAEKGMKPLHIIGWLDQPSYDSKNHYLTWSMLANDDVSSTEDDWTINYNTYVLGRNGYYKLNLVTSKKDFDNDKMDALTILKNTKFNTGMRYEDFTAGTDRVAEYGIAALVTGIAAKKLGLLAMCSVFLIKIWKLLIIGPLILWGTIKKRFSRINKTST